MPRPISEQLREIAGDLADVRVSRTDIAARLVALAGELDVMVNRFMAGFATTVRMTAQLEPRALPTLGVVLDAWLQLRQTARRLSIDELAEESLALLDDFAGPGHRAQMVSATAQMLELLLRLDEHAHH